MSDLAKAFHDSYERLAPSFGYETRADTKVFDPDSPNGMLMAAVCDEVIGQRIVELEAELSEARWRVDEISNSTVRMTLSEEMEGWVDGFISKGVSDGLQRR